MFEPVPGYYCIIQYTPSQYRMEVVNLGVVLFSPAISYLGVHITTLYDRAERFFPGTDDAVFRSNARSILYRLLHIEAEHIHSLDDLQHFVDTRANQIILTNPRPMSIRQSPEGELLRLFRELVDDRPEALAASGSASAAALGNGAAAVPESPNVGVATNP